METPLKQPKVFISYSWGPNSHQELVRQWAERLLADGVEVILDQYSLKEGQDTNVFMEKMVTDPSISHVLIICDKRYAERADSRKGGAGTETQIISQEVYNKVEQSKFIPVASEVDDYGNWYLPAFLKSRKFVDFSTSELVNKNWEQLIRLLWDKPRLVKPAVGKPPAYLLDVHSPASPVIAKFALFKQAVLEGKSSVHLYRQEVLDACIEYADSLRIRQRPVETEFGQRVLADCTKLKLVRDHIIDWVLLEAPLKPRDNFQESLIPFLERLLEVAAKPKEMMQWSETWFEAHRVFAYETFIYVVAALLKRGAFEVIHEVFAHHYLQPDGARRFTPGTFADFECFWTHSDTLQVLAVEGKPFISAAAELIRRQADRSDLPFEAVMEAEALILLMALIKPTFWRAGTLLYHNYGPLLFFKRAELHKGFEKLSIITGISDAAELRLAVQKGQGKSPSNHFGQFARNPIDFFNLEKLDSI